MQALIVYNGLPTCFSSRSVYTFTQDLVLLAECIDCLPGVCNNQRNFSEKFIACYNWVHAHYNTPEVPLSFL